MARARNDESDDKSRVSARNSFSAIGSDGTLLVAVVPLGGRPRSWAGAPDGSMHGRATLYHTATFWASSQAGAFEDYLMVDVWNFLMSSFPIRPEREAHALLGASMGGSAAVAQAIKHRDKIKTVIAFMP